MKEKDFKNTIQRKERQIESQQEEMSEKEKGYSRQIRRKESAVAQAEVERDEADRARNEMMKKTRDMSFRSEQETSDLRDKLQRAEAAARRAEENYDTLSVSLREAQSDYKSEKAENALLTNKLSAVQRS